MNETFAPGRLIAGRFFLEESLGTGAMGEVWRAVDSKTNARVALKLLHPRLFARRRAIERFAREARILEELRHPNIARAIASGADGGAAFIALELIDGTSLESALVSASKRGVFLPETQLRSWFADLAGALGHAHAHGVIHRDVKPRNVMITKEGGVKILDFGVAKTLDEEKSKATTRGRVLGTFTYLAPEQIDGEHEIDRRADVFALGTMLFELLTLHRPWLRDENDRPIPAHEVKKYRKDHNGPVDIVARIRRGARPLPSACRADLGALLDAVVVRAIAADRNERFDSTIALSEALISALDQSPLGSDRASTVPQAVIAAARARTNSDMLPPVVPTDLDSESIDVWTRGGPEPDLNDLDAPYTAFLIPDDAEPPPHTKRASPKVPAGRAARSVALIFAAVAVAVVIVARSWRERAEEVVPIEPAPAPKAVPAPRAAAAVEPLHEDARRLHERWRALPAWPDRDKIFAMSRDIRRRAAALPDRVQIQAVHELVDGALMVGSATLARSLLGRAISRLDVELRRTQ